MMVHQEENPFWSESAKRDFRGRMGEAARGPGQRMEDLAVLEEIRRQGMLDIERKVQDEIARRQNGVGSGSYHTAENSGREAEVGPGGPGGVQGPPALAGRHF